MDRPKWLHEGTQVLWLAVNDMYAKGHKDVPDMLRRIADEIERRDKRMKRKPAIKEPKDT